MKIFYSLLLLIAVFGITSNAQSLNPGQVTDNVYNKALLTERFSLINGKSSVDKDATATNAVGHKEINFSVSYNAEENSFSGVK
ncbi:MAG TPA: hypothetical protein VKI61_10400, partial [Chitinophagaceae bacterium]|nr:hypothetical protein [Chitinophagaceae bacterium]